MACQYPGEHFYLVAALPRITCRSKECCRYEAAQDFRQTALCNSSPPFSVEMKTQAKNKSKTMRAE